MAAIANQLSRAGAPRLIIPFDNYRYRGGSAHVRRPHRRLVPKCSALLMDTKVIYNERQRIRE